MAKIYLYKPKNGFSSALLKNPNSDGGAVSLLCSDFDENSHWHNDANPKAPMMWYRSSVAIDPTQLQLATGTATLPSWFIYLRAYLSFSH